MKKTIFDFYDDIDGLINTAEELRTQLRYQDNKIKRLENHQRKQVDFHRFKIIRAIMHNICQGFDEDTAVEMVSEEYYPMLNALHIKTLWRESRRQRNALNLYARLFMARTMKKSGFSLSEIAMSMNLSKTSISKLLKSNAVID